VEFQMPSPEDLGYLMVSYLGERKYPSPLGQRDAVFFTDEDTILAYSKIKDIERFNIGKNPPAFQLAGPRKELFFNPSEITCGIVTCGGLCPGLNDVIRTITLSLIWQYGVKRVLGFRYGYEGLSSRRRNEPLELTPHAVDEIHSNGGTILGSSRGPQDCGDMVNTLKAFDVRMLFVIGGDGTFAGAHDIAAEVKKQNLSISVVGIPKTIDNDIYCCEKTFGFSTAIDVARKAIYTAHEEAKAAWNGIGLVKLMGRDSGFIAAAATLANSDVNFCFIPEVPFQLDGEGGLFKLLERRLKLRRHGVIVIAEGAGQHLVEADKHKEYDASGNVRYKDIGLLVKQEIKRYFKEQSVPISLKYIDPSYTIRSCPANADDSAFCLILGQMAVHAAMAGKTDMFVSYWHHHFVHVPFPVAVGKRKMIDPQGELWQTLLETIKPVSNT